MKPCDQCPWRLKNQGKRHKFGFYTKSNLQRLWNEIRQGGRAQSCHLTDPQHPDHIAVGAKPGAQANECPGSVILIRRELELLGGPERDITEERLKAYRADKSKRRLKKTGLFYWVLERASAFTGTPLGGAPLPDVDPQDPEIGLPDWIK